MRRCFVDTNVFLYARGGEHPYREPCRTVLRAARDGRIALDASVEVVQEFAHVLLRRGLRREDTIEEATEVRAQCQMHDFDTGVLSETLRLLRRHPDLDVRDAVHAATVLRADVNEIISVDVAFDAVDGVRRLDPIGLADHLTTEPDG